MTSFETTPSVTPPSHRHVVVQGAFCTSDIPEDCLTAVLGSCVATCLWDQRNHLGGMNHLLLAGSHSALWRNGAAHMERLINVLLQKGAQRENMVAKVFGGADMSGAHSEIGRMNRDFVEKFLADEGIHCAAKSTGGSYARNVRFWPQSGRASMRLIPKMLETHSKASVPDGNDVELF